MSALKRPMGMPPLENLKRMRAVPDSNASLARGIPNAIADTALRPHKRAFTELASVPVEEALTALQITSRPNDRAVKHFKTSEMYSMELAPMNPFSSRVLNDYTRPPLDRSRSVAIVPYEAAAKQLVDPAKLVPIRLPDGSLYGNDTEGKEDEHMTDDSPPVMSSPTPGFKIELLEDRPYLAADHAAAAAAAAAPSGSQASNDEMDVEL